MIYRRGVQRFECDDIEFDWPRCEITCCPAFVCLGMSESLCYPHGIEFGAFTKEQFDENRRRKNND